MSEKEVYYYKYCPECEHYIKHECEEPCDECLTQPVNEDSHKPLYFKQAKKSTKAKQTHWRNIQKAPKNEWTYRSQS